MRLSERVTLDLSAPHVDANPHPLFHALRAEGPVHWSDAHRAWLVVSHEAVNAGFRASWLSSERIPTFERSPRSARPSSHGSSTSYAGGWCSVIRPCARTTARSREARSSHRNGSSGSHRVIERIADDLLDTVADAGGGELQQLFTKPLPALVIADLLGVPSEDRASFQGWSDQLSQVVFAAEARGRWRPRGH